MKVPAKIYLLDKENYSAMISGTYEEYSGGFYISYKDEDGDFIIGLSKGIATVTRATDPAYTVVLEENCPHAFEISTPYGKIGAIAEPLTVKTIKRANVRNVDLVYDLTIGDRKFRHEMKLKIEIFPDAPETKS